MLPAVKSFVTGVQSAITGYQRKAINSGHVLSHRSGGCKAPPWEARSQGSFYDSLRGSLSFTMRWHFPAGTGYSTKASLSGTGFAMPGLNRLLDVL